MAKDSAKKGGPSGDEGEEESIFTRRLRSFGQTSAGHSLVGAADVESKGNADSSASYFRSGLPTPHGITGLDHFFESAVRLQGTDESGIDLPDMTLDRPVPPRIAETFDPSDFADTTAPEDDDEYADTMVEGLSETPAVTEVGTPLAETAENPALTGAETPTIAKAGSPLAETAENPTIAVTAKDPTTAETATPTIVEAETPTIAETAQNSALTGADTPAVTGADTPAMTETDTPTMTESDTPAMTESDTPAMTESDTPAMTEAREAPSGSDDRCEMTSRSHESDPGVTIAELLAAGVRYKGRRAEPVPSARILRPRRKSKKPKGPEGK